ncbi:MAG TPA: phosphodiesterase [Chthoniobacterales bacterium]
MLIVQISDPHLRPKDTLYKGKVDSNGPFAETIRQINGLNPKPDLVLLSGDIADEGTPEEYENARRLLAELEAPLLVIPGNHDDRENFRAAFQDHTYLPRSGALNYAAGGFGPVRIVALDVTLPGLHHGAITAESAAWLDAVLAEEPDRPTIIFMHQPPFACGVPYLDDYWCKGGDVLAAVVARYPAVERVLCGHVHRLMQVRFGGTLLCTAPSTSTTIALQLRPDAVGASFVEPPAFLLHHWKPDTGIVTHLILVGTFSGPFWWA